MLFDIVDFLPDVFGMSRIYRQIGPDGQTRSPYYFADYVTPDGSRRRISTRRD